eukprot:PITA_02084
MLTNALVLKIVDPDKEFVVCRGACKEGLGRVLMQEWWMVCYESRKLNEHEQNYVTHYIELATIIHALKMWRHYILGKRFVLMSDYSRLRVVDDLSRRVQVNHISVVSSYGTNLQEQTLHTRQHDERYQQLKQRLQQRGEIDRDEEYHLIEDGLVRFKIRTFVLDNSELKKLILREFNVETYSGHSGYHKTLKYVMKL